MYTFRSADSPTGAKVGRFVRTAGTFADGKVDPALPGLGKVRTVGTPAGRKVDPALQARGTQGEHGQPVDHGRRVGGQDRDCQRNDPNLRSVP